MAASNGRLATSTLTAIPSRYYTHGAGAYLRADAAAAFIRLAAAFEARFGKPLRCISFYRTIQRQQELFNERYVVRRGAASKVVTSDRKVGGVVYKLKAGYAPTATPGLSNHGLGQAVDFNAGVQTTGTPEHTWFKANAPAYGWDWTEGKRNGEPWHWTYDATQDRYRNNPAGAATAAAAQTAANAAATAKTAAQIEEEELMAAKDEIMAAIAASEQRTRADVATVNSTQLEIEKHVRADVATVHASVNDMPRRTLTYGIERSGGQSGKTNAAAFLAWNDAHVVAILEAAGHAADFTDDQIKRLTDAVASVSAEDVAAKLTVQAKQ